MKYLILLFFFPAFLTAQANFTAATKVVWGTDYETALKLAKKEKKNILLYFTGSDWCMPCKVLKKDLFDSEAFLELSDQYVLLYADFPRNKELLSADQIEHNQELLAKLNKKGVFPLLKVLNANGKELGEFSGYSMDGETGYHMNLLNKYKS